MTISPPGGQLFLEGNKTVFENSRFPGSFLSTKESIVGLSILRPTLKVPSVAKSDLKHDTFEQFLDNIFFSKLQPVGDEIGQTGNAFDSAGESRAEKVTRLYFMGSKNSKNIVGNTSGFHQCATTSRGPRAQTGGSNA